MSEGRKILIYTTGQQISKTSDSIIQYVSSLPGTITIHISTNENFSGSMHATIPEWLGYFKSTDLVLTNSYHGVIFSTIFNKNFIFIPNNSRSLIDEHIKFFMQKLGLDKRLVITRFKRKWIDQLGSLAIDWVRVNMRLEEWRQQADQFLDLDKILRSPGAASSNGRM